jgi:cell division protein FtsL
VRRGTVGFLVLCAVVLGAPVLGLVTLNALLAQTSFRVDDLQQRIQDLSQQNLELTIQHAELSAPGRVAAWARRHGMRLPDDIQALHVSGAEPAATRQGADPETLPEASLEPAVGDGA